MDKSALVEDLKTQLQEKYQRAIGALAGAHEAATGDDTKAENKYDTRGLEASYLAAGQAEQADELSRAITTLETFHFPDFDFDDPIDSGALVETESDGEIRYYLLAPAGGGLILEAETGEKVTVLGPASPLSHQLIGLKAGASAEESDVSILEIF